MLKKLALWFITFGLSFFVSEVLGWTEQGKAFLYIDLFLTLLLMLLVAAGVSIIADDYITSYGEANALTFLLIFITFGTIAFSLFATWVATKLFTVDFYVAYQIMGFGKCFCANNSKKSKDNH